MDDLLADLRRQIEAVPLYPKPVSYVVLSDLMLGANSLIDMEDSRGRRYLFAPSNLLDRMTAGQPQRGPLGIPTALAAFGVPVYKHKDMPEGWPDNLPGLV